MRLFGRKLSAFPKAIVLFVAVLLVASGICGIDQVVAERHGWYFMGPWPNTPLANFLGFLNLATLVAMLISAAGLAIVLLLWPILTIFGKFAPQQKDRSQKLFDPTDAGSSEIPPDDGKRDDQ